MVGFLLGNRVGLILVTGDIVGLGTGITKGSVVGLILGKFVGCIVGFILGKLVGCIVGLSVSGHSCLSVTTHASHENKL